MLCKLTRLPRVTSKGNGEFGVTVGGYPPKLEVTPVARVTSKGNGEFGVTVGGYPPPGLRNSINNISITFKLS